MQDVIQQVTTGLVDLSVSRPKERLSWGIPVPDDPSQTIYVWLDALINYLTKANYPFQIPGREHAAGWPADVHVIGKDIVRFHCIYWPAFLLALDLPLPKQIMTHAHWTLNHEKMSKSTGNVVNPFFALDRFGSDTMRFYLIRDGGIKDDRDYDNAYIVDRYKTLQGSLGNLVTRVVRGKGWNVRRAVGLGCFDDSPRGQKHLETLKYLPAAVDGWMAQLEPGSALGDILEVVDQVCLSANQYQFCSRSNYASSRYCGMDLLLFIASPPHLYQRLSAHHHPLLQTNQYMQHASPWNFGAPTDKHGRPKALQCFDLGRLDPIIYACAESIRICAILLQPVMPERMKHVLDLLGVDEGRRMIGDATVGADREYGIPMVDVGVGRSGVVFPPLTSDF